jgi:hypothetical protein
MSKLDKLIFTLKSVSYSCFYFLCFYSFQASAQIGKGGKILPDLNELKESVGQWGTTFAGIAVLVSGGLGVSSLILPWRFLKEKLGTPAWIGLASAVFVFIIMSFFGNSIQQYMSGIYQCPMQIVGFPCN